MKEKGSEVKEEKVKRREIQRKEGVKEKIEKKINVRK